MFVVHKSSRIILQILTQILDSCVNGGTLGDPGPPAPTDRLCQKAFEKITGYPPQDMIGRNCRFLQEKDREQEGCHKLRAAIDKDESIEVALRNFQRDGMLSYNKLSITPLLDNNGQAIFYLGMQHDVTKQIGADEKIHKLDDKLSDLG